MTDDLKDLKRNPGVARIFSSRIRFEEKKGKNWLARCPFHSEKTASFALEVKDDGAYFWKCFGKCGTSGDVFDFVEQFDHVSKKEAIDLVRSELGQSWQSQAKAVDTVFRPIQVEKAKEYKTYPLDKFAASVAELQKNPDALAWLKKRGISPETAKELHWGYRQDVGKLCREAEIADKGWVAFPSVEGDTITSIKYRSIARKDFCRQSGMVTGLYNIGDVDPIEDIYVVEGEPDLAVMKQAGFRVISLPSGSVTPSPEMKDIMMGAGARILAGDCDGGTGNKIMERLWSELETDTFYLKWPGQMKDANQTFLEMCKGDVSGFRKLVLELTQVARTTPMPHVYSIQETLQRSKITNLADHPDRLRFPWPAVDGMAILLPGSVTAVTATSTGMGKSCFLMNVSIYAARVHGEVVLNYQTEMNEDEIASLVASHVLRKDRNFLTMADHHEAADVLKNIRYYVGCDPSLDRVQPTLDLIESAIKRLSPTLVLLDHIHYICRNEKDEIAAQANAMQRIHNMASKYRVKFVVVGQPRKAKSDQKGKVIHISDWKGSETLTSDAHAAFVLHRDYIKVKDPANPPKDAYDPRTQIHCQKARFHGIGASYCELMFFGEYASFENITYEPEPGSLH